MYLGGPEFDPWHCNSCCPSTASCGLVFTEQRGGPIRKFQRERGLWENCPKLGSRSLEPAVPLATSHNPTLLRHLETHITYIGTQHSCPTLRLLLLLPLSPADDTTSREHLAPLPDQGQGSCVPWLEQPVGGAEETDWSLLPQASHPCPCILQRRRKAPSLQVHFEKAPNTLQMLFWQQHGDRLAHSLIFYLAGGIGQRHSGLTPNYAQESFLEVLKEPYGCQRSNLSWLWARQMLCPLFYHSSPTCSLLCNPAPRKIPTHDRHPQTSLSECMHGEGELRSSQNQYIPLC